MKASGTHNFTTLLIAVAVLQVTSTGMRRCAAEDAVFARPRTAGDVFQATDAPPADVVMSNIASPDVASAPITHHGFRNSTSPHSLVGQSAVVGSFACTERTCGYEWQLMPGDLIYRSYIAAPHEPRMATVALEDASNPCRYTLSRSVPIPTSSPSI